MDRYAKVHLAVRAAGGRTWLLSVSADCTEDSPGLALSSHIGPGRVCPPSLSLPVWHRQAGGYFLPCRPGRSTLVGEVDQGGPRYLGWVGCYLWLTHLPAGLSDPLQLAAAATGRWLRLGICSSPAEGWLPAPADGKIASKLAFLPPDPTYTLMCDESGNRWTLHPSEQADWQYSSREKDAIECFMTRTSKGNRIACMFVRCSPNAKYTLLFSHGSAVDLGQMSSFYIGLGSRINCNIFSYDYSGYGASSGKPTEKNLYADIEAAWLALRTRYGIRPENVIIHGQRMRVAFPDTKKTYCLDAFPNIDKIS
eukprot:bmy_00921T0